MTEAAEAISLHELCERFRRIYMPAVCDAMYHLGIEEQVLPSSLRPLHPEQRIVGEAFTLEGRDIEGLRQAGFQVFYRGLSPLNGIGRWEMTAVQRPVTVGGVTVNPGDIVHAEFDGILVVPREHAVTVLEKAEEIVGAEGRVRREQREGDSPWSSFERHGYI